MQGFNMGRYIPPEYEGTKSANQLAGRHALGNRARKAGQGILTVRFEMPFAVWCTTCPKETIIGQGVRFNAEKKKVGNYYSTPIYSFRMKHILCGGWIEIRTDPQNTAYVVTEGGKKRDTGEDKVMEGDIEIRTEEERERLRNDAFATLEVTIDQKQQNKAEQTRIDELLDLKDKDWDDTYAANRRLRKAFRVGRKDREKNAKATEALQDKMSLGLDIVDETEDDRTRAALTEFGSLDEDIDIMRKVQARGLFTKTEMMNPSQSVKKPGQLKSEAKADASRHQLQKALSRNARAVVDPFSTPKQIPSISAVGGLKRKRCMNDHGPRSADWACKAANVPKNVGVGGGGLVDYDDDSD